MRRSRASRLFALLFAPWFLAVVAAGSGNRLCPYSERGEHAMHHGGGRAHDGLGAHAAEHAAAAAPHESGDSHGAHHECTCLGCCCAASVGVLFDPTGIDFASAVAAREDAIPELRESIVGRVEHSLPFATAPPGALS